MAGQAFGLQDRADVRAEGNVFPAGMCMNTAEINQTNYGSIPVAFPVVRGVRSVGSTQTPEDTYTPPDHRTIPKPIEPCIGKKSMNKGFKKIDFNDKNGKLNQRFVEVSIMDIKVSPDKLTKARPIGERSDERKNRKSKFHVNQLPPSEIKAEIEAL